MKKILVFGASGFLGSELISQLLQNDVKIYAISRTEKISQNPKLIWVESDVSDENRWKNLIDEVDIVVNLIGVLREDKERGITYESTILAPVKQIVNVMEASNNFKHTIFVSTHLTNTGTPEGYRNAKKEAENLLLNHLKQVSILRPTMMYGEGKPQSIVIKNNIMEKLNESSSNWHERPISVINVAKTVVNIINGNEKNIIYEVNDME